MITTALLISHLLADFLLQPTELIKLKLKHWTGTLVHVTVFATFSFLLLLPYILHVETILVILGITAAHFLIDISKIHIEKNTKYFPISFYIDQILHFITVIVGGVYLSSILPQDDAFWLSGQLGDTHIWVLVFIAVYILYVLDVIFIQKKSAEKFVSMKKDLHYLYSRTTSRIALFTSIYIFHFATALFLNM